MDFEARRAASAAPRRNAREFGGGGGGVARRQRVAPGAGMNLDDRRADRRRGFDLRRFRRR